MHNLSKPEAVWKTELEELLKIILVKIVYHVLIEIFEIWTFIAFELADLFRTSQIDMWKGV